MAVVVALSLPLSGQEPGQEQPRVCPLSDNQEQNAIKAFAKLAPIFAEPRCSNCHGGVSPFGQGRNHPAESGFKVVDASGNPVGPGPDEDLGKTFQPCQQCHSDFACDARVPCWRLAPPEMRFTGKDATGLCKLMKRQFPKAVFFIEHMIDDRGGVPFLDVAFAGTMGLNEFGLAVKQDSTKIPDPPKSMTRTQALKFSREWVSAMGGEFKGDERCGCEPVHSAVQVFYTAAIDALGVAEGAATMGPVNIPITFHDDGSYEGTGTLPFVAVGVAHAGPAVCKADSQGSMQIKVSGNAVEDPENSHMHIELTNISPNTGSTAQQCNLPLGSGIFALRAGDKMTFSFDVSGKAGDESAAKVPLPGPVAATVHVKVIDLSKPGGSQP